MNKRNCASCQVVAEDSIEDIADEIMETTTEQQMTNQQKIPILSQSRIGTVKMCPSGTTVGGKIDFKQTRRKERGVP